MIEYDRFIPLGGMPKPKRQKHPKDPAITDLRMFQVWVVYSRPDSRYKWILNGFVHRKYIRSNPRALKRLRRKLGISAEREVRWVQLPCAWSAARATLTGAHRRPQPTLYS